MLVWTTWIRSSTRAQSCWKTRPCLNHGFLKWEFIFQTNHTMETTKSINQSRWRTKPKQMVPVINQTVVQPWLCGINISRIYELFKKKTRMNSSQASKKMFISGKCFWILMWNVGQSVSALTCSNHCQTTAAMERFLRLTSIFYDNARLTDFQTEFGRSRSEECERISAHEGMMVHLRGPRGYHFHSRIGYM